MSDVIPMVVQVVPKFGAFYSAMTELQEAIFELDSDIPQPFFERFKRFLDSGDFVEQAFRFDSRAAGAGECVVVFEPTEFFDRLLSAVRAGDFDVGIFEL